jgi:putative peptidoglycan lipid II flippase
MGILKSASVVSGATLLSRILGMIRDIACASLFGAGMAWDAFVIAWRVPNLFRRLLGEGALSSAFIPVFSGVREEDGRAAALDFFRSVLTLLTLVLAVITVLGVAAALLLPGSLFGSDGGATKAELTLSLLAILFPYVLVINVLALFMAVLNSENHFFAPSIAPAVLNVFWIAGTQMAPRISEDPQVRVKVVAAAILAGGVVQLFMQLPFLRVRHISVSPRFEFRGPALRRMLLLMVPMVAGLAPVQVNLLFDTLIAEAFVPGDGANSCLFYGNRLMQFPLALVGIALGVVVFPLFSRQAKAGRTADLQESFRQALGLTFFLSVPAAVGLVVLARPLITLIFEWGEFTAGAARATANVLAMYAIGVPAYCGLQILTRLYYSLEEVSTPMWTGASMVLVNLLLNLALVFSMREAGLALATSLAAILNLTFLTLIARRKLGIRGFRRVALSFGRTLLLAAVMGAAVWWLHRLLAGRYPDASLAHRLLRVFPPILLGAVVHLGGALLFRFPETKPLITRLR